MLGFVVFAYVVITAVGLVVIPFPDAPVALGVVTALAAVAILVFRNFTEEQHFLTTIFLAALGARIGFGIIVHVFELRDFFGADAETYDYFGAYVAAEWLGEDTSATPVAIQTAAGSIAGRGMNNFTGFIYLLFGRSIFVAQSICAFVGAATVPMTFFCAQKVFNNRNVSRFSAIAVALFPSFIIWSAQLLKDGLVIFLLVLTMTMVLHLQEKFSYVALGLLILSLFGIMTVRFYIFYVVLVAVAGSFLIGFTRSTAALVRGTGLLIILGLALTYLGVIQNATREFQLFGSLERVQASRLDLSQRAESGFGQDVDVSTAEGALSTIPLGLYFLMLAPFPWHATNLRQAITIPDVLLWWSLLPFLIVGIVYTLRNRLRASFPILIFTLLLTLAYSIFQGNVGTAYRQRTQIQVFLFILIAVGWTVFREQRENNRIRRAMERQRLEDHLRAGALHS